MSDILQLVPYIGSSVLLAGDGALFFWGPLLLVRRPRRGGLACGQHSIYCSFRVMFIFELKLFYILLHSYWYRRLFE